MLSHKGVLCVEANKFTVNLMDDASSVEVPIGSGDLFTCKLDAE